MAKSSVSSVSSVSPANVSDVNNLMSVIKLDAESSKAVVITTAILTAAATIDGAKESARIIIQRALADNCTVLIDLLNNASGSELTALKPLVKRYVQDLSSATANPEYTIEYNKSLDAYAWTKRDAKVLARQAIVAQIDDLQSTFSRFEAYNANGYKAINNLTVKSEAEAKRKLALYTAVAEIVTIIEENEALLTQTDALQTVLSDVSALSEYSLHNVQGLKAVVTAHVDAAKALVNQLKAARLAHKAASNGLVAAKLDTIGLSAVRSVIDTLPTGSLAELAQATTLCDRVVSIAAYIRELALPADGYAAVIADVTAANLDTVLTTLDGQIDTVKAVKHANDISAAQQAAELADLQAKHDADLEAMRSAAIDEAIQRAAETAQKELESDCGTYGLTAQFDHMLTLTSQADIGAYKRQLNAAIVFASDIDDADEQDRIVNAYESMPVELAAFKDAYGDFFLKTVKARQAEANKPKTLLGTDTVVNNDSNTLANQLVNGLDTAIDALIAKHPNLECSRNSVLIAIYQQLGVKIDNLSKVRDSKAA